MNKRSGTESRKKILSAAVKVFSSHGYAGASIREIAKASGLSIGGVYLYFKNKEELYLSLIKERISEKEQRVKEIIAVGEPPSRTLSVLIEMHLDYALKNKELILTHIKEHGFSFGMGIRREYFQRQTKIIGDIIKAGIKTGDFRKCDVHQTANLIMGALRGISLSLAIEDMRFITAEKLNQLLMYGILRNNDNKPKEIKKIKRGKR
jgi:AcrR family transcriptional regulator